MIRTLACLFVLGLCASAQDGDKTAKLIEALDGDDLEARDAAEQALIRTGRPALEALRKALGAATGESKSRLERIVKSVTEPRWRTDVAAALAEAKASKKPILVFSTVGDVGGYA